MHSLTELVFVFGIIRVIVVGEKSSSNTMRLRGYIVTLIKTYMTIKKLGRVTYGFANANSELLVQLLQPVSCIRAAEAAPDYGEVVDCRFRLWPKTRRAQSCHYC